MAGIYIHIPFCKQKCSYCDFHFSTTFEEYREAMISTICEEIEQRKDYLQNKEVKTIYFGGGTPSLLTSVELSKILTTIKKAFKVQPQAEVTLEANPDDITQESLEEWKRNGVNRLSIGLQSFKPEDLQWMNRAHSADESLNCVQLAKSTGFDNLTVDLMYGLPELSLEDWKNHIHQVIEMGVDHVSAYCLTVETKTALSKWVKEKKIRVPNEDTQSEQFLTLIDELGKAGYHQYEISNFAKKGSESKHNSNYWKGEWYLGVGPSAHSFNGTSRSWNISNNRKYLKDCITSMETEELSIADQVNELLLTGLRTVWGVSKANWDKLGGPNNTQLEEIEKLKALNLITESQEAFVLTKTGRLQADYIASELFI